MLVARTRRAHRGQRGLNLREEIARPELLELVVALAAEVVFPLDCEFSKREP